MVLHLAVVKLVTAASQLRICVCWSATVGVASSLHSKSISAVTKCE